MAVQSGVDHRLLRCLVCKRTDEKTATELLEYTQTTWPRCCGEVMAYYLLARPDHSPNDTVRDLPVPLPPG